MKCLSIPLQDPIIFSLISTKLLGIVRIMLVKDINVFTPPTQAGCDIKSILKWSKAGLNLKFFFSKIGWVTKAKEPSLPDYLPIAMRQGRTGFMPFPRTLVKCKQLRPKFELGSPILFLKTITIILQYLKRYSTKLLPCRT